VPRISLVDLRRGLELEEVERPVGPLDDVVDLGRLAVPKVERPRRKLHVRELGSQLGDNERIDQPTCGVSVSQSGASVDAKEVTE